MRRLLPSVLLVFLLLASGCGGSSSSALISHSDDAGPDAATTPTADSGSPTGSDDGGASSDATLVTTDATVADDGAPIADTGTTSRACVPGESVACVGPGGCATNQVCTADGSGFGPCVCATSDAAALACIPGASIGCVGPGGCVSNQVCSADGSGYGACTCASDGGSMLACVPGQSIACDGPAGCMSFQVCKPDGSGYGPCDCPDAGSDGGDAGSEWTPAQLPGLVLWLDDTYGMVLDPQHPGTLIHWLDRSGRHNDATLSGVYYAVNGTTAFAYAGYGLDPGILNGLNAVSCPNEGYEYGTPTFTVPSTGDFDFGTGDFGVVMVTQNVGTPWSSTGLVLNGGGNTLVVEGQSVTVSSPPPARFNYVVARGAALSLDVNGATATGPTNTQGIPASNVSLCPGSGGDIAEVIAVKGSLSDTDVANVTTYVKSKFGL
jgi:hypothetical protein